MQNNNDDWIFPILFLSACVIVGVYITGYMPYLIHYATVNIGFIAFLGSLILIAMVISSRTNDNPELQTTKDNIIAYVIIMILTTIGIVIYSTIYKQQIFSIIDQWNYYYAITTLSFIFAFFGIRKFLPTEPLNPKEIRAIQIKSFNLKDYIKFDKKDKTRVVETDDGDIFSIFKKDIYIEKNPIWILNDKKIKQINPKIFKSLSPTMRRSAYKPKVATHKEFKTLKSLKIYRMLINRLHNNYSRSTNKAKSIEEIILEQGGDLNFVVMYLTEQCTENLSNFALGQLHKFSKNKDHRELMGAITNASSLQVKTCGINIYMNYLIKKLDLK